LNGILHGGSELAVGAAKLLEEHVSKGLIYPHGEHEFLGANQPKRPRADARDRGEPRLRR
jgi:hypothetical protein